MQIYLAAAMTNPARDLDVITALRERIERLGHTVPTRHVALPDGRVADLRLSDEELAARDLAWLSACDALVAEVSAPSHGVGIEVMAAVQHGKPILVLAHQDALVSRLLLGLSGIVVARYASAASACAAVERFASELTTRAAAVSCGRTGES